MAGKSRTIVLTAKGRAAVREMRLHDAVPDIPEWGWPPERKPKEAKEPKPQPAPETSTREQAIQKAEGRDLFLSPAFVLPGDRLLRIVAGERTHFGTVSYIEKIGPDYRLHLADGGWKTCSPTSAVLVAPRGDE